MPVELELLILILWLGFFISNSVTFFGLKGADDDDFIGIEFFELSIAGFIENSEDDDDGFLIEISEGDDDGFLTEISDEDDDDNGFLSEFSDTEDDDFFNTSDDCFFGVNTITGGEGFWVTEIGVNEGVCGAWFDDCWFVEVLFSIVVFFFCSGALMLIGDFFCGLLISVCWHWRLGKAGFVSGFIGWFEFNGFGSVALFEFVFSALEFIEMIFKDEELFGICTLICGL